MSSRYQIVARDPEGKVLGSGECADSFTFTGRKIVVENGANVRLELAPSEESRSNGVQKVFLNARDVSDYRVIEDRSAAVLEIVIDRRRVRYSRASA